MARKWYLFFSRLSTLKYLFFGIFLSLLIIFYPVQTIAAPTPGQLNQRGFTQLHQGLTSAALQTWESAYRAYKKLNDTEGMTGSLINQSLALQANASYPRACQTLIQALEMENWVCQPIHLQRFPRTEYQERLNQALQNQPLQKVQVVGLRNLGDVLRQLGKVDASSIVLHKAWEIAQNLGLENPDLLLSLANTERSFYEQAKSKYKLTDEPLAKQKALNTAQAKLLTSLELYQKINSIPAQLNQLHLLLKSGNTNTHLIHSLIQELLAKEKENKFSELPAIESIYARLHLAQCLIEINNKLPTALTLSQKALSQAEKLDNQRAESLALGTLANIYSHLGQEPQSIKHLQQAMGLAQSVQAWDIAYQWQWQLGQFYKKTNNIQSAIKVYAAAVYSLDQVRGSILSINPEIQFAFNDKVEPVYQEYMELLLSQKKPNFRQVIKIHEQLKLAELENFLQCGKIPSFSLLDAQNYVKLPPTIYLIKLSNKTEVILQTSQGKFYNHNLDTELIDYPIKELINLVQNQNFNYFAETDFILYAQEIYYLLLSPIKEHLPKTGNLLFVLDTYFQNLPFSLLHDGNNYLIHSYIISVASSFQLSQQQVLKPGNLKALIAAISEESPSFYGNFNPLPEVKTEIENIRKNAVYTSELLNNQFTSDRFRQKIRQPLPILHISTHAQFSSDPEQTFILAWDRPMNLLDLNTLFKQRQNSQSSIDLLVLSACQTAKGDRRSALGIAGLATQSGARSTIASLWLVNSESTALLMSKFYQGLRNGLPKAEALRQAQLDLRSHAQYSHPYYWAAFVLVGTWD
ncbi:CHAT domain-containing protein [Nodularia sp. NIES-3585]|uniref:CHAT domain-containing protein n=1 Tax=Nodularia sp. NIES-3585 TaxID=1973477 RepID=UPI000B5C1D6C|nr:CHAT domain-containing protein [Nodularia sp. NIES-3585]GAX38945.1 TPR repeat-containing protein [Nodularia sp. NIES-3585]